MKDEVERGRWLVIAVILVSLGEWAVLIILNIREASTQDLLKPIPIIFLLLEFLLCAFLYKRANWARWVASAYWGFSGMVGLLAGATLRILGGTGEAVMPVFAVSAVHLAASLVLMFVPSARIYFNSKKSEEVLGEKEVDQPTDLGPNEISIILKRGPQIWRSLIAVVAGLSLSDSLSFTSLWLASSLVLYVLPSIVVGVIARKAGLLHGFMLFIVLAALRISSGSESTMWWLEPLTFIECLIGGAFGSFIINRFRPIMESSQNMEAAAFTE